MVLQPTNPLRPKNLIDNCLKIYSKTKVRSLATGRNVYMFPYGKYNNIPRQELTSWFWDDGTLYILDSRDIKKNIWTSKNKKEIELKKKYSLIDIDDKEDLVLMRKIF